METAVLLMGSGLVPCNAGSRAAKAAALQELHAKLPLSFEKNAGQAGTEVKFLARSRGYTLALFSTGAVLQFAGGNVRMELTGASSSPEVSGLDELPGKFNYFFGNDPDKWRVNIPGYAKVRYRNVYPGVDLVYYGDGRRLEFDFIVAPKSDPGVIQLLFEGAHKLEVNAAGDLVLHSGKDTLVLRRPLVYQKSGTEKHLLDCEYALSGKSTVGFQVKAYDPGQPLIIDPVVDYATYLGGGNGDVATAIAVDRTGSMYLAGSTYGDPPDYPLVHPQQPGVSGQIAVVSKLDPSGGSLVYSSYFGSSATGFDRGGAVASAMAVDADGNAYVAGFTSASDFPTRNPAQRSYGGAGDAFVLKLDSTGSALVYSTYAGGPKLDEARAIAVDALGRAYITGSTTGGFPTTIRSFQPMFGGGEELNGENRDAFVARLSPTGSALEYATYLGGNGFERADGIAVDAANNAYVTGFTRSLDFPVRNPLQGGLSGGPALRTRDGGKTWNQVQSGLPSSFVGSLAVDPRNPSTLYAAGWSGVYKSVNGGDSWKAVNTGLGYLRIARLAIDPSTSRVYAITFHGGLLEPPSAVYVSVNGGDTWRQISSFDTGSGYGGAIDFAPDPSNAANLYVAHSHDGVLKSTDGGAAWRGTGLTGGASQLLVDPVSPSTLFATRIGGGVSKSIDGGDTWFSLERVSSLLAIDPKNSKTVYGVSTGGEMLKSTDGGSSWSTMGAGPAGPVGPLVVNPSDSAILYASGRNGLFKSTDGGATWLLTALKDPITALAIDATQPDTVFAGTSTDGGDVFVSKLDATGQTLVYSTYLGGRGWDLANAIAVDAGGSAYITGQTDSQDFPVVNAIQPFLNPGSSSEHGAPDAFVAKLNPAGSALEYATYLGGGSHDAGQSIAVDAAGNAYVTGSTGSIDFPVKNPFQDVLAGGGRIFKSTDSGATWSGMNSRLNKDVFHLTIHPGSPSTFFTPDAGKSEDGGLTWRSSATQPGGLSVFAFERDNPQKVYAAGRSGVFVSADRGDTWRAIKNGLPDTRVRALAADPSNASVLYAGSDRGIFKTSDGGEKWATIYTGEQPIYAVGVAPSAPSRLYAVTFGDYVDKASYQACFDVLASDDAGATWNTVKKGVVCLYNVTPDIVPELSVTVDPATATTVYVTSQGDPWKWDASVFRSTDGGATFQRLKGPGYEPCVITTVIMDPKTPSTLYAGGGGVLNGRSTGSACVTKSADGGETWQSLQPEFGIAAPDDYGILALAIDPANPATLYATVRAGNDAWVAKLNPVGSSLLYSTYLGGGQVESAAAIAIGAGGAVYVAGSTSSTNFPTVSPLQGQLGRDSFGSGQDLFVVRIKE